MRIMRIEILCSVIENGWYYCKLCRTFVEHTHTHHPSIHTQMANQNKIYIPDNYNKKGI